MVKLTLVQSETTEKLSHSWPHLLFLFFKLLQISVSKVCSTCTLTRNGHDLSHPDFLIIFRIGYLYVV